ncbi:MAG: type II toxin-antitoxin system HicB family antitoxin [Actinobacteria bacterium]|nr:type II toxin-antitoxin system HicB family antitoxin [Actinomycetota bacterium]
MSTNEYIVKIHEEDGSYWAEVLELPGCFASGRSLDELREALAESIGLYLASEPGGEHPGSTSGTISTEPGEFTVGEMRIRVAA